MTKVNLINAICEAAEIDNITEKDAYAIYKGLLKHKRLPGTEHMKSLLDVALERPDIFREMVKNIVNWLDDVEGALAERATTRATIH